MESQREAEQNETFPALVGETKAISWSGKWIIEVSFRNFMRLFQIILNLYCFQVHV